VYAINSSVTLLLYNYMSIGNSRHELSNINLLCSLNLSLGNQIKNIYFLIKITVQLLVNNNYYIFFFTRWMYLNILIWIMYWVRTCLCITINSILLQNIFIEYYVYTVHFEDVKIFDQNIWWILYCIRFQI